ncbi:MAG TPA: NTP transferase domain-containing protein [bacterium]|nr:NTP transferase domain-containing protein [bacterium]HPP08880.1 NTP transferase domain-containing protein [bacterium]
MNTAVIFARGAEKGKRNINLYLIDGKPLIYYSITAALGCKDIHSVFVSTDDEKTANIATGLSCKIIRRKTPADNDGMGRAIVEAVKYINENGVENIVILSGNNAMISSHLITKSLDILKTRQSVQSVISVWKARHDHPNFAIVKKNNHVSPLLDKPVHQDVFFYDGAVCAIRKQIITHDCFNHRNWWAYLPDCVFLVRPWPTGRDVHDSYGLALARWWIENALIDVSEEI